MKKLIAFLMVAGLFTFGISNLVVAQEEQAQTEQTEQTVAPEETPAVETVQEEVAPAVQDEAAPVTFRESIKKQFIDGGPAFRGIVLVILLIGMAISIERIIYLTLASANSDKLLKGIEEKMKNGDVEGAKQLCKDTRGPVASIFYQGLLHYDQGIDTVEKTIVSYGGVQSSLMENGLSWIGLFIALAPSLGFLGTVIGMVQAFDAIQAAGDISPNIVAGGMKVALITTVAGLIVAMILQVFYNYILSRIDSLAIDMEDSSISFIDVLTKYQNKK